MHFYPDQKPTRFTLCKNGCVYAAVEDTDTCKYCTDKPGKVKRQGAKRHDN